jgi:hypothetical protein
VVERRAAGRVKDAAGVQLEWPLVGLDRHADRLVCGRLQQHRVSTDSLLSSERSTEQVALDMVPGTRTG